MLSDAVAIQISSVHVNTIVHAIHHEIHALVLGFHRRQVGPVVSMFTVNLFSELHSHRFHRPSFALTFRLYVFQFIILTLFGTVILVVLVVPLQIVVHSEVDGLVPIPRILALVHISTSYHATLLLHPI